LWALSVVAASVYVWSLWGESFELRARAFTIAWLSAWAALAVGAQWYRLGPGLSLETLLYPLNSIVSALLLGAVSTGMLLGHWYLIDLGLSIEPFRNMLRFYIAMLAVQVGTWLFSVVLLLLGGSEATRDGLALLVSDHSALALFRIALSPLAAAGLAWMIRRTLAIPQTMAATGLFYVAILAVLVGEMMGRFVLFRTHLPM
jgi:hypothetical protein